MLETMVPVAPLLSPVILLPRVNVPVKLLKSIVELMPGLGVLKDKVEYVAPFVIGVPVAGRPVLSLDPLYHWNENELPEGAVIDA